MADTGAPWNLPYPLPTDLVRDGADAIKDLAEAAAAGLDLAGNPGIGPNVVQAVKLDTFTTNSATFTNIPDLSVTITPSTATAKVLLVATVNATTINRFGGMRFDGGNSTAFIGATAGSRFRVAMIPGGDANTNSVSMAYVDSPNTTDPTTYTVQVRLSETAGTLFVNRSATDTDSAGFPRGASSLVAIEVDA